MDGSDSIDLRHYILRGLNILKFSIFYPHLIPTVISRLASRIIDRLNLYPKLESPSQTELIQKKDWDILIILDACRFDAYIASKAPKLGGRIYHTWSPASITPHWVMRTWLNDRWNDVIYISANVFINKSLGPKKHLHRLFIYSLKDQFMDIVEVWRKGTDRRLHTVPPWNVYRAYKTARLKMKLRKMELGRDYKMVIHFMQPHTPFITQEKLNTLIYKLDDEIKKMGLGLGFEYLYIPYMRKYLRKKDVDKILWNGYMNNLNLALSYVEKIVKENRGKKIIVTSDHGEMMGEYNLYFHFNIENIQLRLVPYHIIN